MSTPTYQEELEITRAGGTAKYYRLARKAAEHAECLEIIGAGGRLRGYSPARKFGATHTECLAIARVGGTLGGYGWAREEGATHTECLEVARAGGTLYGYANARHERATHAECLDAIDSGESLSGYSVARQFGADHSACLDLLRSGVTLTGYGLLRMAGATELEAAALARHGKVGPNYSHTLRAYRACADHERATPALLEALVRLGATWTSKPEGLLDAARVCIPDHVTNEPRPFSTPLPVDSGSETSVDDQGFSRSAIRPPIATSRDRPQLSCCHAAVGSDEGELVLH